MHSFPSKDCFFYCIFVNLVANLEKKKKVDATKKTGFSQKLKLNSKNHLIWLTFFLSCFEGLFNTNATKMNHSQNLGEKAFIFFMVVWKCRFSKGASSCCLFLNERGNAVKKSRTVISASHFKES